MPADAPSTLAVVGRYVGEHKPTGIPAYADCDLRLGWHAGAGWELAFMGSNLCDRQHPERKPNLAGTLAEIPRTLHLQLTWRH